MVLVDTSVLIAYLKGIEQRATIKLQSILDSGIPYGINSFIYQEALQGVQTRAAFQKLKAYLDTQTFYRLADERESFAQAAQLYVECRKKGITVNSTIDFLIAQTAIENHLALLHHDRDFEKIAQVCDLKFF